MYSVHIYIMFIPRLVKLGSVRIRNDVKIIYIINNIMSHCVRFRFYMDIMYMRMCARFCAYYNIRMRVFNRDL